MFEWQFKELNSNVIKKGGNRYQISYSHTNDFDNPVSRIYYLMENGFPMIDISFNENEDLNEVLFYGNRVLNDIDTCQKCGKVKLLKYFNGMHQCQICINLLVNKKLEGNGRVKESIKSDILFYKSDSEAHATLQKVTIPDVFKDYSNKNYIYIKGIFKVPLIDKTGYRYYPVFFHSDCQEYNLHNIYFLKLDVLEKYKDKPLTVAEEVFSLYWEMCYIAKVTESVTAIASNFDPLAFQLGKCRTLSYIPIHTNQEFWPNYFSW